MKRWAEWLVSIALVLLVVTVLVALVIGFVRWRLKTTAVSPRCPLSRRRRMLNEAEMSDTLTGGAEFGLGSPQESTIWKRRRYWHAPDRRYTGTSTDGHFFKIVVHPQTKTIHYADLSETEPVVRIAKYEPRKGASGIYDVVKNVNFDSLLQVVLEAPGQGLIAAYGGAGASVIFGFPERAVTASDIPAGVFSYMHFSQDPGATEAGFVESATGGKPGAHHFDHQSFLVHEGTVNLATGMHVAGVAPVGAVGAGGTGHLADHLAVDNGGQVGVAAPRIVVSSAETAMAVHFQKSGAIVMLPQLPSADLPFPVRARYRAVLSRHARAGRQPVDGVCTAMLEVTAADGAIRLTEHGRVMFVGRLAPVSHIDHLYAKGGSDIDHLYAKGASDADAAAKQSPWRAKLVDPCYGTYVARSADGLLVAQFADEWCLISAALGHPHIILNGGGLRAKN